MKHLYAPWRTKYVENNKTLKDCPFCLIIKSNEDEKNFVLKRFNNFLCLLNLYPYNTGHILIIPCNHVSTLQALTEHERKELIEITNETIIVVEKILKPDGINIGLNLGKAAGAGLPEHLHQHILPRWFGDTGFLPILAETKQISVDLHELYSRLKPHF